MTAKVTSPRGAWPVLADPIGAGIAVAHAFRDAYLRRGFVEHEPVGLVSRSDPTVRFIGSTISVLKPMLEDGAIPSGGTFLVQPVVRTQNLKTALDPDARPFGTTAFVALGTLTRPALVVETVLGGFEFLRHAGVDSSRLVARVSSSDPDLRSLLSAVPDVEVEVDGYEQKKYRHVFGLAHTYGRNFNFAVRSSQGELHDIGNFILIEREGELIGAEIAFGVSMTLCRMLDLEHPIQSSPVAGVVPIRSWTDLRLADCLAAAIEIAADGVVPTASSRGRILRGYLQALAALAAQLGVSHDQVEAYCSSYEAATAAMRARPTAIAAAVRAYVAKYSSLTATERDSSRVHAAALSAFTAAAAA